MRILITGINGFVAQHFLAFLTKQKEEFTVLGIGRSEPAFDSKQFAPLKIEYAQVDLLNRKDVGDILKHFKPQYLLHLASISSVGHSWKNPNDSFVNNTNIFLNLVDQIRLLDIPCRILSIGSSEEYGNVSETQLPLTEESPLHPISPYAVARVSQEMISKIYADGYGMDIIMTRSFNHIGPGQKNVFVISSFAKQLVHIANNPSAGKTVITGDLGIIRDFVDVRDVVKAYYLLLKEGKKGEVYNICSGTGVSLQQIMDKMCGILNINITLLQDANLIRPNDNRIIIGSADKIKNKLGWIQDISLDKSLTDIINWWKEKDA
ncbi:MAG: GDP-mannose 4,6-dehydratase [Ferruginibacter sp.]|nr:GDP-mannose 4,6-dehydratase [Ferruginibacter sp.]